jgi:hypothetical protein
MGKHKKVTREMIDACMNFAAAAGVINSHIDMPIPTAYLAGPISYGGKEPCCDEERAELAVRCATSYEAERELTGMGYLVYNPYRHISPAAWEHDGSDWYWNDMKYLSLATALILLPGWKSSRGVVKYELPVAAALEMLIFTWENGRLQEMTYEMLCEELS